MTVTREGDTLLVAMPDLTAGGYEVTPELDAVSSDIFVVYIDGYGYDLTFVPLVEDGLSQYARNRSYVATRVGKSALAADRPAPTPEEIARWEIRSRLSDYPVRIARPR